LIQFAQSEALKRGGRTIGVLGCGLDIVYPPENVKLNKKVSQNGAILSEFHHTCKDKEEGCKFVRGNQESPGHLGAVI